MKYVRTICHPRFWPFIILFLVFTPNVLYSQDSINVSLLCHLSNPMGSIHKAVVQGDSILLDSYNHGWLLLDVSDPTSPEIIDTLRMHPTPRIYGRLDSLVVLEADGDIEIRMLRDGFFMEPLSLIPRYNQSTNALWMDSHYLMALDIFTAPGSHWTHYLLTAYDLFDPASPDSLFSVERSTNMGTGPRIRRAHAWDDFVFVQISDGIFPVHRDSTGCEIDPIVSSYILHDFKVHQGFLYYHHDLDHCLKVLDVHQAYEPTVVDSMPWTSPILEYQVESGTLFARTADSLHIFDVSSPESLEYLTSLHIPPGTNIFEYGEGRIYGVNCQTSDPDSLLIFSSDGEGTYTLSSSPLYVSDGIHGHVANDTIAFVLENHKRLHVWDLRSENLPAQISIDTLNTEATSLYLQNSSLLLWSRSDSISVYDVSDAASISMAGIILLPASSIEPTVYQVSESEILVASSRQSHPCYLVDLGDLEAGCTTMQFSGMVTAVDSQRQRLYTINEDLLVYDISDPEFPVLLGELENPDPYYLVYQQFRLFGSFGYLSVIHRTEPGSYPSLDILDLTDPENIVVLNSMLFDQYIPDLWIDWNYLFVMDGQVLRIHDLVDPVYPVVTGYYPMTDELHNSTVYNGNRLLTSTVPYFNLYDVEDAFPTFTPEVSRGRPSTFGIVNIWPNPFNAAVRAEYRIQAPQFVEVRVYDVLGRLVTTLTRGEMQSGIHHVNWQPEGIGSGMYFLHISAGDMRISRPLLLLK